MKKGEKGSKENRKVLLKKAFKNGYKFKDMKLFKINKSLKV